MIIDLNGHKYDTELSFEEQSQDTIDYVDECVATIQPTFNYDNFNRPFEIVYPVGKNEIVVKQIFKSQSVSCDLDVVVKLVRGIEIWHAKDMAIQVIMSVESQMAILAAYPEFAMYVVQGAMPTFTEGKNIYLYDNTLALEYRMMIQYFGGIINDKNIE